MTRVTKSVTASVTQNVTGSVTRKKRPTPFPLPPEFEVVGMTKRHSEHAVVKGWPEWWVRDRFEHFCGVAKSKGLVYVDWDLAFYTFLRNEVGYRRGPADLAHLAPRGAQGAPGSGFDAKPDPEAQAREERRKALQRAEDERHRQKLAEQARAKGLDLERDIGKMTGGIGG